MLFAISRSESKPDSTAQIVKREKNGKRHGHKQGYFASAGEITYPYEAVKDQKNCGDIQSCAAEIDGIPILKTDDYKHTCKHVEAVLFRIAQLFDLAVCFIGGICRDQPRRKSSGIRRSAPSTSLCISGARSILSQSSLRSMLPSSVRGCFYISTSASFGFMISRGAPGVKRARPALSPD